MKFDFFIKTPSFFANLFGLEKDIELTSKSVYFDKSCDKLILEIVEKKEVLEANGFEPEFIVMNIANYERLVAYTSYAMGAHSPPDEFLGHSIVIVDLPVDYVKVLAKANKEWAYSESIRRKR